MAPKRRLKSSSRPPFSTSMIMGERVAVCFRPSDGLRSCMGNLFEKKMATAGCLAPYGETASREKVMMILFLLDGFSSLGRSFSYPPPKTNSSHWKRWHPKRKGSSSNHQFSGANLLFVSGSFGQQGFVKEISDLELVSCFLWWPQSPSPLHFQVRYLQQRQDRKTTKCFFQGKTDKRSRFWTVFVVFRKKTSHKSWGVSLILKIFYRQTKTFFFFIRFVTKVTLPWLPSERL